MGVYQNNPPEKGSRKRSRGKTRNADRLAAFAEGKVAGSGDWGGCDSAKMQAVVVAITALGGAVTFGLSRDMGAHSVTLMLDDGRKTLWFNGDADLDVELEQVKATLDSM